MIPQVDERDRLVVSIAGLVTATQLVWSILTPVLPAFAQELGIDPVGLGLLVGGFGLGRIVANIPAGYAGTRVNRLHLLVGGATGVVVLSSMTGLATSFGGVLALRILTGAAAGVAMTSGQTLVADSVRSESLTRAMATMQGLQLTGAAVGPAIGGVTASLLGLRAPFVVAGAACAVFVLWIVLSPRLRRRLVDAGAVAPSEPATAAAPPRRTGGLVAACLVGFSAFFCRFGVQQALLPLVALQTVGLSVGVLGLVFFGIAVANVLCLLTVGRLTDRLGHQRTIVGSSLGAAVVIALFVLPVGPPAFVGLCLLFGVATGVGGPIPAAYLARITQDVRRGPAIGLYRTCGDLGGVLGPLMVGVVGSLWGLPGAALVSAAVPTLAAVGFGLLTTRARPKRG
ncbi:hypothetical protein GCM10010472_44040 [Pseudonocardia halophobica]|uniref:Major facilitator superfamily (MFS) profile domain-containing protein n=1 Tax=Pseudonocardia halophobica TaxID=29401 RepID=A0A9W6LCM1_9PSEU|nr:MFS transporter [Pseudonocardia halophobica]GLL14454.1 hypothetical protein GCM10017577_56010 [Pseudonocardia halophobica]